MTYKEIVTYIEEIPRFTRKHSLAHTRAVSYTHLDVYKRQLLSVMQP